MQGEAEAAPDVAGLLDDAAVVVRRKAAEVCFDLRDSATVPALRRALARDEDDVVRRWTALGLARIGDSVPALAEGLLRDASRDWRRRAALVLGERGEERACDELATWWGEVLPLPDAASRDGEPGRLALDLTHTRDLLAATRAARCRTAVPALVRALEDVRARPYVADALGALGDPRARAPLLASLASEPYVTTRPHEARALLSLGVRDRAWPVPSIEGTILLPLPPGAARILLLLSAPEAKLEASLDSAELAVGAGEGAVRSVELGPEHPARGRLRLLASAGQVEALWVIPTGRLD
jgi:hypothetical protein